MDAPVFRIEEVTSENLDSTGLFCSRSKPKADGYQAKLRWIKERFTEGLEYHVLRVDEGRKDLAYRGMIEYMPGNVCWRGVNAPNYMVIHCLWVVGRHKGKGYGGMLVQKAVESASEKSMDGVVVITVSKGGWSPKKTLFEKLGFNKYDSQGDNYELYALKLRSDATDPSFVDIKNPSGGAGFQVFSSNQCPYMCMTVDGVSEMGSDMGKKVTVKEMESRGDVVKHCMDPYGTFHVVLDGEHVTSLPGGPAFIKKTVEKHLRSRD